MTAVATIHVRHRDAGTVHREVALQFAVTCTHRPYPRWDVTLTGVPSLVGGPAYPALEAQARKESVRHAIGHFERDAECACATGLWGMYGADHVLVRDPRRATPGRPMPASFSVS